MFHRILLRWLQSRWCAYAFFACTLIIGLWVAKDYGISWDEKAMLVLGEEAYNYVVKGFPYPTHVGIRFHGAFLEIILHSLQELLRITYARHLFIFRHAAGYTVYWVGLLATYAVALRCFKHRGWALLAAVIYFLSPRQFGHAFVNTRDIPAMVFFTIKMLTLLVLLDHKTPRYAVLHGLASGMVLALRVGGLFVPIYTAIFLALSMLEEYIQQRKVEWRRYAMLMLIFLLCFAASTILLWPLLWKTPLLHFIAAMDNMMHHQQQAGGFYLGQKIGYAPWHWIPIHLITKTPLLYVILSLAGVGVFIRNVIRNPRSIFAQERNTLLFVLWFTIPLAIVIVLGATLFDEWRHMYFTYPAIILLCVYALRAAWDSTCDMLPGKARSFLQASILIIPSIWMTGTGVWMVQNHPLQYVYFSLPSRFIEHHFELDYWGLSYRQGFEWILAHDTDPVIPVLVTSSPGWENLNILTSDQRRRIVMWKKYTPKYVLDNFDWMEYQHVLPDEAKVHSVMVSGMEVLDIYRDPNWSEKQVIAPKDIMEDHDVQMWFDPASTP